jgi:hypothetical protein
MEKNDLSVFAKLMASLGELYGKSMSESLVELYWAALKRFELSAIQQAIKIHINHPERGQYMLKPNDVVRYLEGSTACQALQAWSKVIQAIKTVGQYDSVVFDDSLIHAVIQDMGGWIRLCKLQENELNFRAREFERRYEIYLLNKPDTYPKKLIGLLDIQNMAKGFKPSKPLLIGNEKQALAVYQGLQNNNKVLTSILLAGELKQKKISSLDKVEE